MDRQQFIMMFLWQGGRGARFNKGLDESNDVKVRIPYSLNTINTFKLGRHYSQGRNHRRNNITKRLN